jgi:hypothetical protein
MRTYQNILLVSGTGRNVGKTTFACKLIDKFKDQDVVGLEISPHLHDIEYAKNILASNEKYLILKETNTDGIKDSSKMLINGASEVFYIQATDDMLYEAFSFLLFNFIKNRIVICESAALAKFIKPGVHFCVTPTNFRSNNEKVYKFNYDYIVFNDMLNFDFDLENLEIINKKWYVDSIAFKVRNEKNRREMVSV